MFFINYRTDDELVGAVYLAEKLAEVVGAGNVFLDRHSLRPSDDFEKVIEDRLSTTCMLLALIGPRWAGAVPGGGRRIDNQADWVRREIATAFAHGVDVTPVLLRGASLPKSSELPADIAALAGRHRFVLHDSSFAADAARLVALVTGRTEPVAPTSPIVTNIFNGPVDAQNAVFGVAQS